MLNQVFEREKKTVFENLFLKKSYANLKKSFFLKVVKKCGFFDSKEDPENFKVE